MLELFLVSTDIKRFVYFFETDRLSFLQNAASLETTTHGCARAQIVARIAGCRDYGQRPGK